MKKSIILLTSMLLLFLGTTKAQEFNPNKNNYLVFSKNIKQLKPVLKTDSDLSKEDGDKYGEFHIVICGETVTDIVNNSAFNELLLHARNQNVKVFACGLSLDQFNVSPDQLPEDIDIIPNGILYGLQLTREGFITLTI